MKERAFRNALARVYVSIDRRCEAFNAYHAGSRVNVYWLDRRMTFYRRSIAQRLRFLRAQQERT